MFIGEYRHGLDAKNRLIIPAKFRDELGDTFIVTVGFDGCLNVYTMASWERMAARVSGLPMTKQDSRQLVRVFMGSARQVDVDGMGRIPLHSSLLKNAGITKKCVLVGVLDHIEIWDEEKWDSYYSEANSSINENAENLTEFLR
ncbi:MAG: division/cell wall cluster transcriptional repressor MraZ [Solobacterium sp.]|jgi:MraZ protein|nr:division/cell wall cluster transcriptional repressor MraZ [Erysipelotrichaceae bacterium]MBQ1324599.1 division/cell wall cluster transcriptional repressor MraZ [Solobacterium sp.]MBQ1446460.1 division/cell wall cluster transcriptional repressor MraZ [Solobacterium sp.]MBR2727033.1 division/cell wall cluster transcriptional repressor MraZ [Solobacterium sp.]MCR5372306.1 division/cell wall cluster transcriptional repressor MraZ [Solobacterium sp.]